MSKAHERQAFGTRKEIYKMSGFLMAAGRLGSIAALIALLIVLVKQLIVFVGFLMFVIKIGIIIAFVGLMLLIVITYLSTRSRRRREAEGI
jgi:Flp pilus assembly protein TadB